MDTEKLFSMIQVHIKDKEYDRVAPIINEITASVDDTETLLKCASLLKVVDDEKGCQKILERVIERDHKNKMSVAVSLRTLGRPEEAYTLMKDENETDDVLYEKARTLLLIGESEEALAKISKIKEMINDHKYLRTEVLCSLGEFKEAYEVSMQLVNNENSSYRSLVNLCSTMILMGKNKDAVKTAKQHLKEGKDADSLALNAYVMRINGKIPAAANYAHRAITADHRHKGALETMAYCLIEKGRFIEAKVIAGAINESEPGSVTAVKILDACRQASQL